MPHRSIRDRISCRTGRPLHVLRGAVGAAALGASGCFFAAASDGAPPTVTAPLSSTNVVTAVVSPAVDTINVPNARALTLTLRNAAGGILGGISSTWTSSVPAIAVVSTGSVRCVVAGTVTVTTLSQNVPAFSLITCR